MYYIVTSVLVLFAYFLGWALCWHERERKIKQLEQTIVRKQEYIATCEEVNRDLKRMAIDIQRKRDDINDEN